MDLIKKVVNLGEVLEIRTILKSHIDDNYYYKIIIPAIKILCKHNKIKCKFKKKKSLLISNELNIVYDPPYWITYCHHSYYDGKIISYFADQLNAYLKDGTLLPQIILKKPSDSSGFKFFNFVVSNSTYNKFLGNKIAEKITEFPCPIKASNIVSYVQNIEKKPIIYLRGDKTKTHKQGLNFNIYVIYEDQTLKDAIIKEQILKKTDFIKHIIIQSNFIMVNLYPHFSIPDFTEKLVLDNFPAITIIDDIICNLSLVEKQYKLMPPSNTTNTCELYCEYTKKEN